VFGVFMPDFVTMLDNIDLLHDFGAPEQGESQLGPDVAGLTMRRLVGPPLAVEEDSGLIHALAALIKHQWQDLPVVDKQGGLVRIASRVDTAAAFFGAWTTKEVTE